MHLQVIRTFSFPSSPEVYKKERNQAENDRE